MGGGVSKNDIKLAKIQSKRDCKIKPFEVEWSAKKEMELAKTNLAAKKMEIDLNIKKLEVESGNIKNTQYVQTQLDAIKTFTTSGFKPNEISMLSGVSFLTLREDLADKELAMLKEMMAHAMQQSSFNSDEMSQSSSDSDTESEGDSGISGNHVVVSVHSN